MISKVPRFLRKLSMYQTACIKLFFSGHIQEPGNEAKVKRERLNAVLIIYKQNRNIPAHRWWGSV